jgi:YidC/Oxa1 family membrane protein insertase
MAVGWPKQIAQIHEKNKEVVFESLLVLEADKLQHEKFDALASGKVLDKGIGWFAYSGRYFLAAMVPSGCTQGTNAVEGLRLWLKQRNGIVEAAALLPPGCFDPRFELYLGPKELDRLTGHSLRRAVDLGWFSFVALPMLRVLKFSHSITGNYGTDIILLTILIKILFFPLTQKSFKSMKEMQKLQPQMTAIRERLKDKPDEMNKEIMELYRRNKVNPLGGCLPMLLQMPVFIGLYQALLNSVELRHAPFAGWINDLSAPDRLGSLHIPFVEPPGFPVLTLLMGASMVIQQWMTPVTTADPTQQRMMMLMPVVFTFMFISFPSGLTLYWLVNNILTIAQQYVINRTAATR